jgi:hypothetical protein
MATDDRLKDAESINLEPVGTKSNASLCLYADNIDIAALTRLLGHEPTNYHRKGDKIKKHSPPAGTGLWSLDAPDNLSFIEKLEHRIKATTPNHKVWSDLSKTHTIRLCCALFLHSWTDGFVIPAPLLKKIGDRHWEFSFSAYSAEGNEIVGGFLEPGKPIQDDKLKRHP